jgi:hypothetical protein
MKKPKITKYIWIQNARWKVEQIIRPTKFDCYLLLSRKEHDSIHEDSKTTPIYMILIDANNDTFYPDTKQVRDLIRKYNCTFVDLQKKERELDRKLQECWLKALNFD